MKGVELTPETPVDEVATLAARAEDAGFDHVFASCHYNNRAPFVALTRMAMATQDVALGPGVANPYETHPVKLASQVATLNEVSDGRAVMGIGAGDASTLRNLGVERDRPLRRVLESFEVARDLWRGDRVTHDGTFTTRDAGLNYETGPIPVFVGGQGPHMLRMAGKRADGALVNASHPDDVAWAADRIAEGRAERSDPADDFTAVAFASVSVAEDRREAREAARPPVAFIAAGAAPPVLERHGLDQGLADEIGAAIEAGRFDEAFGLVSSAMIDAFSVAGTPAEVGARVTALREHVDGVVAGSPLGPDRETAITLLGDVL